MDYKTTIIIPLFEKAEEYGKTSLELVKLKALNKTADVYSTIATRGIVALPLIMFVAVLTIGVSIWLGELLGKLYYGFFCVAGFYGVVWAILYLLMRHSIKKRIGDAFVYQILN